MTKAAIAMSRRGHIGRLLKDLLCSGWTIDSIPDGGPLPPNGLKLILRSEDSELRLRLFAYKVTSSGRNRPHERRVEITTTYRSGLRRLRGFRDVVLGVDVGSGRYVGVDSRRLRMGGATHNASSFFDLEGLSVQPRQLLLNPRAVAGRMFANGIETHAFFDRTRLAEYLFNHEQIHAGLYAFGGLLAGAARATRRYAASAMVGQHKASGDALVLAYEGTRSGSRVRARVVAAVARGDVPDLSRRKVTPEELKRILSVCDEIGALGEQVVLSAERARLRRLGLAAAAERVERVSLQSVGEGYDIRSFENDGRTHRYLEVKSTSGRGRTVDVSRAEWNAARRLRRQYYLVRVSRVREPEPSIEFFRDPVALERDGHVSRTPSGWRVDLRNAGAGG